MEDNVPLVRAFIRNLLKVDLVIRSVNHLFERLLSAIGVSIFRYIRTKHNLRIFRTALITRADGLRTIINNNGTSLVRESIEFILGVFRNFLKYWSRKLQFCSLVPHRLNLHLLYLWWFDCRQLFIFGNYN